MKPFELFKRLTNAETREEFVRILKENRIKPGNSMSKKKGINHTPTY